MVDGSMSLVTVSAKRNRVYPRKFDHDEARARHTGGETLAELAAEYGVSPTAIRRVVDPATRRRMVQRTRRHVMSGCCPDCGQEGTTVVEGRPSRCTACSDLARATSVGDGVLRCQRCRGWMPDDMFPKNRSTSRPRRGRHECCRACQTIIRQEARVKRMVPCERCGKPRTHPKEAHNRVSTGLCRDCYRLAP